jgi:hypothetical protein
MVLPSTFQSWRIPPGILLFLAGLPGFLVVPQEFDNEDGPGITRNPPGFRETVRGLFSSKKEMTIHGIEPSTLCWALVINSSCNNH